MNSPSFIFSLFIFFALFSFAGSALLAAQFRKNRPAYVTYWIIGLLATGSGVILFSLKDNLPEFIAYKMANGLASFGAMMSNYAISNLAGSNPILRKVIFKATASGIFVIATLLLIDEIFGSQYQPAFVALVNCIFFYYGFYLIRKYSQISGSIFTRLLMLIQIAGATLWLVRLITILFFQVGFAYQGGLISAVTYIVLLLIGLLRFVIFQGLVMEIVEHEKHELITNLNELKINFANQKVTQTEQRLQHVLKVTGDGIWDWNLKTGEASHNERWLEMLGRDPSQIKFSLEDFKSHIHPEDVDTVMNALNDALEGRKEYHLRYRMIHLDGHQIWVDDKGAVVEKTADGKPLRMVGAISDVTEEVTAQNKIQELIFFDQLTKLPNRHYIRDRVQRAIGEAGRTSVYSGLMYLDLDEFKVINDTYGHHIGDNLLKEFGSRIQSAIRPSDMIARIGGDEFLILFERLSTSSDGAKNVLEEAIKRILVSLSDEFDLGDMIRVRASASMGVVVFGGDDSQFDEVLKYADIAMYAAKEDPASIYKFFDESLKINFNRKNELHLGLKDAIHYDQFFVDYQPLVNRQQECVGYEALARWKHPLLGMVMPDDFIPFAEKSGQMNEVGESILRHIFSNQSFWGLSVKGHVYDLMINVSAHQLMNLGFADQFISLAQQYQVPLDHIHLEVTEGAFLTNTELAISVMNRLSSKGVKFVLDDFGTGYSSLAYLQKLPIHYLKLDKSFVAEIASKKDDQAIAENILSLARTLDLKVVAEGVETKEQFDLLLLKGCDYFQGWYFGRPGKLPEAGG